MGKYQQSSDDEMDIEQEAKPKRIDRKQRISKPQKSDRPTSKSGSKALSNMKRTSITNQAIRSASKFVNMKKQGRTIEEKQDVFKKIFTGLKSNSKNKSKHERKKQRELAKRELRRALDFGRDGKAGEDGLENVMQAEVVTHRTHQKTQEEKEIAKHQGVTEVKQLLSRGVKLSSLKSILLKNAQKQ